VLDGVRGALGGVGAVTSRPAGAVGGVSRGLGGLRARAGGARRLLDGFPRGLDHPHLALGALRDVTDGGGDLAHRAARLVRRGGHFA
jgi:hypothetical protein